MSNPLFHVDPELIASITAANSYLWKWSGNTKGNPDADGGEAYWNEQVEVMDCGIGVDQNDSTAMVAIITYGIPASAASQNVGAKPLKMWYRYWPAALKDRSHEKHKRSILNMDRLLSAVRAAGVDVTGGVDFDMYLNEQGGMKWMMGKRMIVLVKHNWYNGKARQEFIEYGPSA